MKQLGWAEWDIVRVDVDDRQARALGLALNRTAELVEWNTDALAELLEKLHAGDVLDRVAFSSAERRRAAAQGRPERR